MDIAVNLVETYLRSAGYLTLAELGVYRRAHDGSYQNVTDVDVVGIRFPGDIDPPDRGDEHPELVLLHDPALLWEPDTIDLIIGEVKQGEAKFNRAIRSHEALHSVLHRVRWLFPPGGVDEAVAALAHHHVHTIDTHGGARLRMRLVAFGQSGRSDLHTISLSHIISVGTRFLEDNLDVLRTAKPSSPAGAFLQLLAKTGHTVVRRDGTTG